MVDNDVSGIINTVLGYSISASSNTDYKIECKSDNLEKLLNLWLERININIKEIPTGLAELSKEYFKERWAGSSFCVLRIRGWEEVTFENNTIEVPTIMWYANGASIYVKRQKNYTLGSDEYYLDKDFKKKIPAKSTEEIIVQKPYDRWFEEYPNPYLVRQGVLKNWLGIKTLQDKSDEVISKVLPYLFLIQKGTENLFLQGDVNYTDDELKELTENFKEQVEKYRNQKGKTPTNTIPFDTKYEHLIPDLSKILKEELYRQGYRAILAGLGFIDMLEIAPSRQESRLNPRAFLAEVNDGVAGFKAMLMDVVSLIIQRNLEKHPKLFGDNNKIKIINSPLKINVEQILSDLRSAYDRGVTSIETYQEVLGLDYDTEKERRQKELKDGDEELFYPHMTINTERDIDIRPIVKKPKNEKLEDQNKTGPEKNNFKNAEIINEPIDPNLKAIEKKDLEEAPYTLDNVPAFIKKMTKKCQETFVATFNQVYKDTGGDEGKAFAIAYASAKRCMKKQGYIYNKETKTWKKIE